MNIRLSVLNKIVMFVIVARRLICTKIANSPFSHIRRILTHWVKTLAVIIAIIPLALLIWNHYQYPTVAIIVILIITVGISIISLSLFCHYFFGITYMSVFIFSYIAAVWCFIPVYNYQTYRKTSNISRTLEGNKIVDNSDVVGASPVGAAPTTSSFST